MTCRTESRARDAFAYWLLRYRRIWRGTIVISVANPVLFLTAMGAGLGTLVDHHDSSYLHGHSYLAFLAPGLLAAAMMLEHCKLPELAVRLRKAIGETLNVDNVRTGDLGGRANTAEFTRALVKRIGNG